MAKVLMLYNQPLLPADHPDAESEHSVVGVAAELEAILSAAGWHVSMLGLGEDPAVLWRELQSCTPDIVFNLFEGNMHNAETESFVAGLLEWSGIPYTGSPPQTLSLARAKHTAKHLLKGAGLATADFLAVAAMPVPPHALTFPVIVKPALQDGSVGVDHASVCVGPVELERRVAYLLHTYGPPAIVEEFIDGREFQVGVVEIPDLRTLPPIEIVFPNVRPGKWPILTYDGKWDSSSPDFDTAPPRPAVDLDTATSKELDRLALAAYRLFGCRDYARVDFRLNGAGQPFILEVNPNPEISAAAAFAGSLGSAQMAHHDFVQRLAAQALSRRHRPQPTFSPLSRGN